MACAGDVPTLETLAAADILRRHLPDLKIRVVNVVDLMTLQPPVRTIRMPSQVTISMRCSPRLSPCSLLITAIPG
jgi:phosphoketolase